MRHRYSLFFALSMVIVANTACAAGDPWWNQGKIRFFWNQWRMVSPRCIGHVETDNLMAGLAKVGATVFVDPGPRPPDYPSVMDLAASAKKHGIRFFGNITFSEQVKNNKLDAPMSIDGYGNVSPNRVDPFFRRGYDEWLLKPALEMAKSGLVDGIHVDWECYEWGEGNEVYNDEYFIAFLKSKGLAEDVSAARRFEWLEKRGIRQDYQRYLYDLTKVMFSDIAAKVRKIKPDFVFSAYDERFGGTDLDRGGWRSSGMAAGLNSPSAPYFIVDPRWYCGYSADPWWDSFDSYYHSLGYIHIGGTWDSRYTGGQPAAETNPVQWMYDMSMHADGAWVWLEHELNPNDWQTYAAADRRIKATENRVGGLLTRGKRDSRFVTLVEFSGNPELDRKLKQRAYHLDGKHLVRVNNVDSARSVQIRIRFPMLPKESRWTAQDPISGLYFSSNGKSAVWTAGQLFEGLVIPMEKRSEQFVLLSPARAGTKVASAALVPNQAGIPIIESFSEKPNPEPVSGDPESPDRLLFLSTHSTGDPDAGALVVSGICSTDPSGPSSQSLRWVRGNLWSPSWSPDTKKVLYSHYAQGQGQIYVMNSDGTGVVKLSKNGFCDKQPVWSPNGNKIAFVSDRDGDWEVYTMNADGSGQTRLTNSLGNDNAPAWSPDGAKIAFESDRGTDTDVYVMNADGSDQKPFLSRAGDDLEPKWSPDGKHIAATCVTTWQRSLCVADTQTGATTIATWYDVTQPHMWVESPRWSPDGKRIAAIFSTDEVSDNAGITVYDLIITPGEKTRIKQKWRNGELVSVSSVKPHPGGGRYRTASASWYSHGGQTPGWIAKRFYGLSWSPDGKSLAFSSDMDDYGAFYVYTVPVPDDPERANNDRVGFYLWPRGSVDNVTVYTKDANGVWQKAFTDDFSRLELGKDWKVLDGQFSIEDGKLTGSGYILCARSFPGSQRMEYDASAAFGGAGDLSALMSAVKVQDPLWTPRDLLFALRSGNTSGIHLRGTQAAHKPVTIVPGKTHKVLCERDGTSLRQVIDGSEVTAMDTVNTYVTDAVPVEPRRVPGSVSSWPQDLMWGTK